MELLISILVNTSACYGNVHVTSVNVAFAYRDVWSHIRLLNCYLDCLMQLWWWKKFACHLKRLAWLPSGEYLTLRYLSLTCSSYNSFNKSACLSARCFAKLDVLAPLVITDLKHRLQTGFVMSVGLPLLAAMQAKYFHITLRAPAFLTSLGRSAGALCHFQPCLSHSALWLSPWNHAHSGCRRWESREKLYTDTLPCCRTKFIKYRY